MNELSDADVIEALHAEFDRVALPDSLTARLNRRPPADRLADHDDSTTALDRPPRAHRRRRVVSIGLIAAAVAAILVGTVILRSNGSTPSASIPVPGPYGSVDKQVDVITLPSGSVPVTTSATPSASSSSSRSTPSYLNTDITTWLGRMCGNPWPFPAGSAPLLVEPAWPNAIRKGGNSIPSIRYRVTNIGTAPIDTSEDYGVMILRGSTVVGFSGHYTLEARFLILGVGESTSGTSSVSLDLRTCGGQPLPAGTYRFIIAEIIGNSRVAFSEPGEVRVLDR